MPIDRPEAVELVAAVAEHLKEHVAPLLEGQPAFHVRVAINALAIVERTMTEGEAMDQRELESLQGLLAQEGDLIDLNRRLSEQIRSKEMEDQRDAVLAHLRRTVVDKLRLANPRYMNPRH
ncbi:MAG: DUF6285 domain-containing protein [Pseudomonadales bacterium]|jgi:hypothetical protein|nr:DUF6285 domain-containing protein [Pseudomonadales bacterium]MDP6471131.1 DUF6285 domain-containing protein [Pseudomonadales bacterium]MDP6825683.1 DUF6285 domain-containing protein [Pseudomonadales bacterium]MDP6971651.1 DUF6285 domain-containing protein [Pseudomonadales bacterium]|tara:strand:+ start:4006 stop:4368 length:363 start_codon:yes stop_codon:yes gene_type:complete